MLLPNYDLLLFANLTFLLLLFIMAIYRYILTGTLEEIKITSHNVFYNSHQEKICNYILKSYCLL